MSKGESGTVLFLSGRLACSSLHGDTSCTTRSLVNVTVIDIQGGSLAPGLTTFGSPLGLSEIQMESSTNDGPAYGPFDREFAVVGNLDRAADGLSFGGRNLL